MERSGRVALIPVKALGHALTVEAIRCGTEVEQAGFNLLVIGLNGARIQAAVKVVLAEEAPARPRPWEV
jgi:hypothetical protein